MPELDFSRLKSDFDKLKQDLPLLEGLFTELPVKVDDRFEKRCKFNI